MTIPRPQCYKNITCFIPIQHECPQSRSPHTQSVGAAVGCSIIEASCLVFFQTFANDSMIGKQGGYMRLLLSDAQLLKLRKIVWQSSARYAAAVAITLAYCEEDSLLLLR